ncbi:hypothetical protein H9P43_002220 [Blastocladiella emersonii ATCC 22665]|nr:hypothetical protein H9P43_002220 [Blastocladiella emersonii ATCC 22665]
MVSTASAPTSSRRALLIGATALLSVAAAATAVTLGRRQRALTAGSDSAAADRGAAPSKEAAAPADDASGKSATSASSSSSSSVFAKYQSKLFGGAMSEEDMKFIVDAFNLLQGGDENSDDLITKGNNMCTKLSLDQAGADLLLSMIKSEDTPTRQLGYSLISGLIENPEHAKLLGGDVMLEIVENVSKEPSLEIEVLQHDIVASFLMVAPSVADILVKAGPYLEYLMKLLANLNRVPSGLQSRFGNLLGVLVRMSPNKAALVKVGLHSSLLAIARDNSTPDHPRAVACALLTDLVNLSPEDVRKRIIKDWADEAIDMAVYNWLLEESDMVQVRVSYLQQEPIKAPVNIAFHALAMMLRYGEDVSMFENLGDEFVELFTAKISQLSGVAAGAALVAIGQHPGRLPTIFANSPALRKYLATRWNYSISMELIWTSLALPHTPTLLETLRTSYLLEFAYEELLTSTKAWAFAHTVDAANRPRIQATLLAALPKLLDEENSENDLAFLRVLTFHLQSVRGDDAATVAEELLEAGLRGLIKRLHFDPATRDESLIPRVLAALVDAAPHLVGELVQIHHVPVFVAVHSTLTEVVVMAKALVDSNRLEGEVQRDLLGVALERLNKVTGLVAGAMTQLTPAIVTELWAVARDTLEGIFEMSTKVLELFVLDSQGGVYAMVRLGDVLEQYAADTGRSMRGGTVNGVNEFARDLELVEVGGDFVRLLLGQASLIAANFSHYAETRHLALAQRSLLAVNASRFSQDNLTHDALIVMAQGDFAASQALYELPVMKSPRLMCTGVNTPSAITTALQELMWRAAVDAPRRDALHWATVTGSVYTGVRGNLVLNGNGVVNAAVASHGIAPGSTGRYAFAVRLNDEAQITVGWCTRAADLGTGGRDFGYDAESYVYNAAPMTATHRGSFRVVDVGIRGFDTLFMLFDARERTISAAAPGFEPIVLFRDVDTETRAWFPCMTVGSINVAIADFLDYDAKLPAGYTALGRALASGVEPLAEYTSGDLAVRAPPAIPHDTPYVSPVTAPATRGIPVYPDLYFETRLLPAVDAASPLTAVGVQQAAVNLLFVFGLGVEMLVHYPALHPGNGRVWTTLLPALARKLAGGLEISTPTVINFVDRDDGDFDLEFKERTGEGQFAIYRYAVVDDFTGPGVVRKSAAAAAAVPVNAIEEVKQVAAEILAAEEEEAVVPEIALAAEPAVEAEEVVAAAATIEESPVVETAEATTESVAEVTVESSTTESTTEIVTETTIETVVEVVSTPSPSSEIGGEPVLVTDDDVASKVESLIDAASEIEDAGVAAAAAAADEEPSAKTPSPAANTAASVEYVSFSRPLRLGVGVGLDDDDLPVVFIVKNGLLRRPDRVSVIKFSDDHLIRPMVLGARDMTLYMGINRDFTSPLVTGRAMFKTQAKRWGLNHDAL